MSSSISSLWRLAWRFRLVCRPFRHMTLPTTTSIHPETCERPLGHLLRPKAGVACELWRPRRTIVLDETRAAQRLRAIAGCKNTLREVTSPSAHGSKSDAAQNGLGGAKIAHQRIHTQNRLQSLRDVAIASLARHCRCIGAPGTHAPAHAVDALQNWVVTPLPPRAALAIHTRIRGTPSTRCKTRP